MLAWSSVVTLDRRPSWGGKSIPLRAAGFGALGFGVLVAELEAAAELEAVPPMPPTPSPRLSLASAAVTALRAAAPFCLPLMAL